MSNTPVPAPAASSSVFSALNTSRSTASNNDSARTAGSFENTLRDMRQEVASKRSAELLPRPVKSTSTSSDKVPSEKHAASVQSPGSLVVTAGQPDASPASGIDLQTDAEMLDQEPLLLWLNGLEGQPPGLPEEADPALALSLGQGSEVEENPVSEEGLVPNNSREDQVDPLVTIAQADASAVAGQLSATDKPSTASDKAVLESAPTISPASTSTMTNRTALSDPFQSFEADADVFAEIGTKSNERFSTAIANALSSDQPSTATSEARAQAATSLVNAVSQIAQASETAAASRGFVVQTPVGVPMGNPQWNQAVVNRVMWLSSQNISSAELRLDPPELGPLQVRIQVQHDQVQVNFVSQNASVRDTLDQQASRLREIFEQAGLTLNMGVSDQSASERDHAQSPKGSGSGGTSPDEAEQPGLVDNGEIIRLVDHYA